MSPIGSYYVGTMRITYGISLDDYRALHPPFVARAGHNAGYKGVLVVCGFLALVGVFCIEQDLGIFMGCFLVGLGALAAAVAYFFDKQSVRRAKDKYEKTISAAYHQLHCPNERSLEIDEKGFTASCGCGSVTRPWSELIRVSENARLFLLGTKAEGQVIPKAAFHSEGEVTEFRTQVSAELNKKQGFHVEAHRFCIHPAGFS